MGRRRNGKGQPYGSDRRDDGESNKLTLNSWEDVAGSDEEFHMNRDKILLEDEPTTRQKKLQEAEAYIEPSDEEVLAYDQSESDEEEYDTELGSSDDGEQDAEEEEIEEVPQSKLKSKSQVKEVEEDLGDWGPSKSDYYNVDVIETEQDAQDEEAEASRIQKTKLERMSAADFGLEDEADGSPDSSDDDHDAEEDQIVTERLPRPKLPADAAPEESLRLLNEMYPEFQYLAKEMQELAPKLEELKVLADAAKAKTSKSQIPYRRPVVVAQWMALRAYLCTISMYLILAGDGEMDPNRSDAQKDEVTAMDPQLLRNHPIMQYLVSHRELWHRFKTLPEEDDDDELHLVIQDDTNPGGLLSKVMAKEIVDPIDTKSDRKKPKSMAQRRVEKALAEEKARMAEKSRKLDHDLSEMTRLVQSSVEKPTSALPAAIFDNDFDLGEESRLNEDALEEKAQRKRSLKFYTAQITQKANKRTAAGRDYGGDIDVPHKERLRDRQARLNAEAEKRGRAKAAPEEQLGGDSDAEDRREAMEIRGTGSDSDDLYEQVVSQNKKRRLDKQTAATSAAQAGVAVGQMIEVEEIGPDGKRKITYAIAKNKGLTPHRKKEVRNPRVKQKLKFDRKKKKLKSTRAVYTGGEGKGGYRGEFTGIKKGLAKGVKLS